MLSHFFIYFLGTVMVNIATFALIPVYTRYLSTAQFGILEIISNCVAVGNIIFLAGFGVATVSLYSKENDQARKNAVISTSIIGLLGSGLIGLCVMLVCSSYLNSFFFKSGGEVLLFYLAGFLILAQLAPIVPMAYFQACLKSKQYALTSLLQSICVISTNIFVVGVLKLQLASILAGNIICYSCFAVVLIIYTLRQTGCRLY